MQNKNFQLANRFVLATALLGGVSSAHAGDGILNCIKRSTQNTTNVCGPASSVECQPVASPCLPGESTAASAAGSMSFELNVMMTGRIKQLEEELAATQTAAEEANNAAAIKLQQLEKQLSKSAEQLELAQSESKQLSDQLAEKSRELESAAAKLSTTNEQVVALKEANEKLESKVGEQTKTINTLTKERDGLKQSADERKKDDEEKKQADTAKAAPPRKEDQKDEGQPES